MVFKPELPRPTQVNLRLRFRSHGIESGTVQEFGVKGPLHTAAAKGGGKSISGRIVILIQKLFDPAEGFDVRVPGRATAS